jgi:hypothetical protein
METRDFLHQTTCKNNPNPSILGPVPPPPSILEQIIIFYFMLGNLGRV